MEEIFAFLNQIFPLSPTCIEYLVGMVQCRRVEKGETILDFGEVNHNLYFIKTGLLRCFYMVHEKEVSDWFLNSPEKPKILCLGGDPTRREALSPVLSLYIDQISRVCNAPGRLPFALICDEFATVRATNVLTLFATARSNNVIPILAVQDLSQLRTQYTREEADAVLNISGNFICGQTAGETAKWVSERFPRVLKDRSSVSTNSADTSVSVSPQWEESVTPATLAMLSSGEFVGVTADDPGVEAGLKGFHARIVREEIKIGDEKLPIINEPEVVAGLRDHFAGVRREMEELVEKEFKKLMQDEDKKGLVVR